MTAFTHLSQSSVLKASVGSVQRRGYGEFFHILSSPLNDWELPVPDYAAETRGSSLKPGLSTPIRPDFGDWAPPQQHVRGEMLLFCFQ